MINLQSYLEPPFHKVIGGSYFGDATTWHLVLGVAMACSITSICPATGQQQVAQLSANQVEFRDEHACITVSIQANIYTYRVTNLSDSAIVGFEVPQHAAYNFQVPDGWQMNLSPKLFMAWTETPATGIDPGRSSDFSMRVSSKGAVLGRGTVKLKLQSGKDIILPAVWTPVAEPRSHIALIVGVMLFIVLLHSIIIVLRDRRAGKSQVKAV